MALWRNGEERKEEVKIGNPSTPSSSIIPAGNVGTMARGSVALVLSFDP